MADTFEKEWTDKTISQVIVLEMASEKYDIEKVFWQTFIPYIPTCAGPRYVLIVYTD